MPTTSDSNPELVEYLESRVVRRRLFPRALLVGLASGGVAAAFRFSLEVAEGLRGKLSSALPTGIWVTPVLMGALAALGTWIALSLGKLEKDSGGSGIPHMKAVLEGHSTLRWSRLIPVKFSAAVAAIGSGLALGREGPTVQMGGACGIGVADLTNANSQERRALAAAGAGAGLAAAFNAPLAGVTFVLEELQRDFQPVVFGAALLCAAVATVVSRIASGQASVFSVPTIPPPPLRFIPIFIGIGVGCGLIGVLFNRGLLDSSARFSKWKAKNVWSVIALTGVAAGLTFMVSPILQGGGHALTEALLHGQVALGAALAFLLVRLLFVHISYATGVPGGIFAPLLSLGALVGVIGYHLDISVFGMGPGVAACAVAGMCGLFSAVVRAPLTGIILIAEMTGGYDMLLPLLASAFTAYAIAEGLKDVPIYEALLQRDAATKGWNVASGDLRTAEIEIREGSSLDGCPIWKLGLPAGTLIILIRTQGKDIVPRADLQLKSPMRIVVASSTQASIRDLEDRARLPKPRLRQF